VAIQRLLHGLSLLLLVAAGIAQALSDAAPAAPFWFLLAGVLLYVVSHVLPRRGPPPPIGTCAAPTTRPCRPSGAQLKRALEVTQQECPADRVPVAVGSPNRHATWTGATPAAGSRALHLSAKVHHSQPRAA